MRRRYLSIGLPVMWMGLITAASFLPLETKLALHTEGPLHIFGHVLAFTVGGVLCSLAGRSARSRVALVAVCAFLGCSIEVGEHLIYHGGLEWLDIGSDAVGAALGYCLFMIVVGSRRYPRAETD